MTTLQIPSRYQGLAGIGQGGYVGGRLAEMCDAPAVRVSYWAPIPLDTPLEVDHSSEAVALCTDGAVVAEARPATLTASPPPAVSPAEADRARELAEADYPTHLGSCFSCGLGVESLRIHAGPTDDSRFASTYLPPAWTADPQGRVALPYLWAPLDCTAGWRVSFGQDGKPALTGWLAVEVVGVLDLGAPCVVVADADPAWDGRKRGARSALYGPSGELVARSESLWVSVPSWGR